MSRAFFIALPNRGAVFIRGEDRRAFLQGLITQDIALLDGPGCAYGWLLNAQGRFLYDFFMTEQDDTIRLECEGEARTLDLLAALKKFKLRSKINLDCVENKTVFAGTGPAPGGATPDPRHPALGWRSDHAPAGAPDPFETWDRHRIALGIPDGSRDLEPGRALALESNLDRLNGLSFSKGCFIGQELTARMHYRSLVKKRLYTVQAPTLPAPGTEIRAGDTLLGEMRSSCGDTGLALLKTEMLDRLGEAGFKLLD